MLVLWASSVSRECDEEERTTARRPTQDAGGFANETHLLGTYIYTLGTGSGDFGMSSAVSILMLVLTVIISWYYVRSLMKEES